VVCGTTLERRAVLVRPKPIRATADEFILNVQAVTICVDQVACPRAGRHRSQSLSHRKCSKQQCDKECGGILPWSVWEPWVCGARDTRSTGTPCYIDACNNRVMTQANEPAASLAPTGIVVRSAGAVR
jgi:hypothetical protein